MNALLKGTLALMLAAPALLPAAESSTAIFRFPQSAQYFLVPETRLLAQDQQEWLRALPAGSTNELEAVEFGSRVVVQIQSGTALTPLLKGLGLGIARTLPDNIFVLQATNASAAWSAAQRLASRPEVLAAYPVVQKRTELHGPYAPVPTDSLFYAQWHLEHRTANGSSAGVDLNVRAAWPYTMGQGVTIAVADCGIDLNHYELAPRVAGAPHFNFDTGTTNAGPISDSASGAHATEVAGLLAASINNFRMVGVAPKAQLASWVIYRPTFATVSDEKLMDMYQYRGDEVWVQNHSWGHVGLAQNAATLLEHVGISNATHVGRGGLGTVLVRSSGNDRERGANANDDGYSADPSVITVGAVRIDGRAAGYSEPGACLLVAAPSGDLDAGSAFPALFSTDLLGTRGVSQINLFPPNQDLVDYVFNNIAFSGTSASVPLVAGVCGLVLSANPQLSLRDVQQILLLSARPFDPQDSAAVTNGAGLRVSHNTGYGVPDAGRAVQLARIWKTRPTLQKVILTNSAFGEIPDNGLHLVVTGAAVPPVLAAVQVLPGMGPHADTPTASLPLVDAGFGTNLTGVDLTNKAVLIQRGGGPFANSINLAALAGARFAIVYNFLTNSDPGTAPGGDQLTIMGGTDFVPIPSVFIGHTDGENLRTLTQADPTARVQLSLESLTRTFTVTNSLSIEHVGLRVRTDHPLRGDLRITLVSPMGTRSVLQRFNSDLAAGPVNWTYYSTQHFFESSVGQWTAYFSDESPDAVGNVLEADLIVAGTSLDDSDRDGLSDAWEIGYFGTLAQRANNDPDFDGDANLLEQLLATNPALPDRLTPTVDLSRWYSPLARLSWAGSPHFDYQVWSGPSLGALTIQTNIPGHAPETEYFAPLPTTPQFFRILPVARSPL
jgi:subtilisin-like proprotein convertase family protein